MRTSAGHSDRPNEDFVGSVAGAVALLDGAGIRGTESICRHGVAWYTHRLGGALLGRLSRDDGRDLAAILAESIDDVAADHRVTCDIGDPSSPQGHRGVGARREAAAFGRPCSRRLMGPAGPDLVM